ncbi:hypothetical protein HZH66_006835 [Vespula vulgaris]|uniref:Uncharacterized protein n=1 Tax=Vespula vulgaris TaxID=7454 RepID=A0A834K2I3_VESVU|nr:hypothetical protein HZH66_006835 [Vespula vulgaris]
MVGEQRGKWKREGKRQSEKRVECKEERWSVKETGREEKGKNGEEGGGGIQVCPRGRVSIHGNGHQRESSLARYTFAFYAVIGSLARSNVCRFTRRASLRERNNLSQSTVGQIGKWRVDSVGQKLLAFC